MQAQPNRHNDRERVSFLLLCWNSLLMIYVLFFFFFFFFLGGGGRRAKETRKED